MMSQEEISKKESGVEAHVENVPVVPGQNRPSGAFVPDERRRPRRRRFNPQRRGDNQAPRAGNGNRQPDTRPEHSVSNSPESGAHTAKPPKREILANVNAEEVRIAVLENGKLVELFWERKNQQNLVGNIYKGAIENVLPGISSAFINIGYEKNAYLYISDVVGDKNAGIDTVLKKGQPVMIQVAKEAIGTKGMKVTMAVSLPGRYVVFTPFENYAGISKNIENPEERVRLSTLMQGFVSGILGGKGVVVRTEAEGAGAEELEREVRYLLSLWEDIQKKLQTQEAPSLLHKDLDMTLQVARDILSEDVSIFLCDNKETCEKLSEFIEKISPELKNRIQFYEGKTPIFKAFKIEEGIERMRKPVVPLPNGGSIIIQEAESLCAIDVNTGRFTGSKSQEETVTQTNVEAAKEVAHQLRLRNIGGIIVVDFIDMKKAANRNKVMETFAHALKGDRAKIRILPITRLGLIELTRERKRESTVSLITDQCPECHGAGRVLSDETMRIRIQGEIIDMTRGRPGGQVRVCLHPGLAEALKSKHSLIEKSVQRSVKIQGDPGIPWEDYRIILE